MPWSIDSDESLQHVPASLRGCQPVRYLQLAESVRDPEKAYPVAKTYPAAKPRRRMSGTVRSMWANPAWDGSVKSTLSSSAARMAATK